MRWERVFIRLQLAAVVVVLLAGAAWGPRALVRLVLGVGAPLSGEVVPRQIPYRGYVERDGVPLPSNPAQVFGFTLEFGDGGIAWNEPSITLPVSNGQFEVALGDSPANKIPSTVFDDPFVLLSVSVGGVPLVGRQRLLTVPYSQVSAHSFTASGAVGGLADKLADGLVPAGTVTAFAGGVSPAGWLACDGAAVSRQTFAALFGALGTSHGIGDGSTSFNVPDYRGRFLRGVDSGANRDPDRTGRVAMTTGANSGVSVGSVQGDALGSHSHPYNTYLGQVAPGGFNFPSGATNYSQGSMPLVTAAVGGSETRPQNAYVNWIIKY